MSKDYVMTVTQGEDVVYVHAECPDCKCKDARIAGLELSNRCLETSLAVITKNAEDNGNAAMQAEAERDALRVAARDVCWYDFSSCDQDVEGAVDKLREVLHCSKQGAE